MERHNEAAAGVNERVATGIHAVASAVISAAGASRDELDLAAKVLLQDPPRPAPVEIEGSADTFNRMMDAAIESCNASAGQSTRAVRRSLLAKDLDRAGLVLLARDKLAELLSATIEIDTFPDEDDGEEPPEELGAELGEPDQDPALND